MLRHLPPPTVAGVLLVSGVPALLSGVGSSCPALPRPRRAVPRLSGALFRPPPPFCPTLFARPARG
eukprot:11208001-Lingulodinium_polyedra.AAC.1